MVRNYKPKKVKVDNTESIQRALRAIALGMSGRAAAREFGVSQTTIRRHMDNNDITPASNSIRSSLADMETEDGEDTATTTAATSIPSTSVTSTEQQPIESTSTAQQTIEPTPLVEQPVAPMDLQNLVVRKVGSNTVCFGYHTEVVLLY